MLHDSDANIGTRLPAHLLRRKKSLTRHATRQTQQQTNYRMQQTAIWPTDIVPAFALSLIRVRYNLLRILLHSLCVAAPMWTFFELCELWTLLIMHRKKFIFFMNGFRRGEFFSVFCLSLFRTSPFQLRAAICARRQTLTRSCCWKLTSKSAM